MVHKYKIIQTLFFSNFIYRVRLMISFIIYLWFIYTVLLVFNIELTHFVQKFKNLD